MKKLNFKLKNNRKGITLIVLIITIIVLLILAGVSIATLTGENGILTRANEAKKRTNESTIKEKILLAWNDLEMDYISNKSKGQEILESLFFTKENLENKLDAEASISNFKYSKNSITSFKYTDTKNNENYYVKIYSNGNIDVGTSFGNQITPENYGDKIEYVANGITDWRIFYAKGDDVFLISTSFIPNEKINIETLGATATGTYGIYWMNTPNMQNTQQNTLFQAINFKLNNKYENSKYASTLLNTQNWTSFTNEYSDYSIGGPTIEMWCSSWNEKYPNEKIYCNNTSEYGYYVGQTAEEKLNNLGPEKLSITEGYLVEEENNLYFFNKKGIDNCHAYWLASTGNSASGVSNLILLNINMRDPYLDNNNASNATTRGIRTVVHLKNDIKGYFDEENQIWKLID